LVVGVVSATPWQHMVVKVDSVDPVSGREHGSFDDGSGLAESYSVPVDVGPEIFVPVESLFALVLDYFDDVPDQSWLVLGDWSDVVNVFLKISVEIGGLEHVSFVGGSVVSVVFVEPDSGLAFGSETDHIWVYLEWASLVVQMLVASQWFVQNVKGFWVWELGGLGKSVWDSLGEDSELVFGVEGTADSSMFSSICFDDGQGRNSSLLVDVELSGGWVPIIQIVVVFLGFSAVLVLIDGSMVGSVENLPLVADGGLELFRDHPLFLLGWFCLLLLFLFGTSSSHCFSIKIWK
jgi:hypothetical protein